jgi:hypothetical protein
VKKKIDKTKRSRHRDVHAAVDDWGPLFSATRHIVGWALNIAGKLSCDYPEDVRAIERVREFVYAWLDGRHAEVPLTDVLTTIAILFAAIEIDTGIESISLLAPIKTFLDTPSKLPALLRLPGAARDERQTVVIRRFPGRRNAAFTPMAA